MTLLLLLCFGKHQRKIKDLCSTPFAKDIPYCSGETEEKKKIPEGKIICSGASAKGNPMCNPRSHLKKVPKMVCFRDSKGHPVCYESNGLFGRIFRAITKPITTVVKAVTKPVVSVVKAVTKPVVSVVKAVTKPIVSVGKAVVKTIGQFIHHSSESQWANPIQIQKANLETRNYQQIIEPSGIANFLKTQCGIPTEQVTDLIQQIGYCDSVTRRIGLFSMDIDQKDKRYRYGTAGVYDVVASWSGNKVDIRVKAKTARSTIFADTTTKKRSVTLGIFSSSSHASSWRPLTSDELMMVNQRLRQEVDKL